MKYVQGKILLENGFHSGYLAFDSTTTMVELGTKKPPQKPLAQGIITPTFINAHTHIGDSFIKKKKIPIPHTVEHAVAPPYGLKHQLLKEATQQEIILGMKKTLQVMKQAGISWFCDFRESGSIGINQLRQAQTQQTPYALILSRPQSIYYNKQEIQNLLQQSHGIGLSSISDWEPDIIKKIAHHVKKEKKIFALHASEISRENIDHILDLKPNFLVHLVKATQSDLLQIHEEQIPIVICPRSNAYFRLKRKYQLLKKTKNTILIGTDNAMITTPNILDEITFLKRSTSAFSLEELLTMITYTPRKALNLDYNIHGPNLLNTFVVLDTRSLKPRYIKR